MTRGCHSSCSAILLSSLDAIVESQKTGAGGLLSLRGLTKRRVRGGGGGGVSLLHIAVEKIMSA